MEEIVAGRSAPNTALVGCRHRWRFHRPSAARRLSPWCRNARWARQGAGEVGSASSCLPCSTRRFAALTSSEWCSPSARVASSHELFTASSTPGGSPGAECTTAISVQVAVWPVHSVGPRSLPRCAGIPRVSARCAGLPPTPAPTGPAEQPWMSGQARARANASGRKPSASAGSAAAGPAEHLDRAWPGVGRTASQQVADVRTGRSPSGVDRSQRNAATLRVAHSAKGRGARPRTRWTSGLMRSSAGLGELRMSRVSSASSPGMLWIMPAFASSRVSS